MSRFFIATRYLIIIPIIGLGIAAAAFFFFGGIGLIRLLVESIGVTVGLMEAEAHAEETPLCDRGRRVRSHFLDWHRTLYHLHWFLPALYWEIDFPGWLQIHNTEELETSLIGA